MLTLFVEDSSSELITETDANARYCIGDTVDLVDMESGHPAVYRIVSFEVGAGATVYRVQAKA